MDWKCNLERSGSLRHANFKQFVTLVEYRLLFLICVPSPIICSCMKFVTRLTSTFSVFGMLLMSDNLVLKPFGHSLMCIRTAVKTFLQKF